MTFDFGVESMVIDMPHHFLRVDSFKATLVPKTGKRITERWRIVDDFRLEDVVGDMFHEVFHP